MKRTNGVFGAITRGCLALALVGGVGLPVSAWAANKDGCQCGKQAMSHRQEFRAMGKKMLSEAKAEDAALEKMVAELNRAPGSRKADLLTKLVAQHHKMVGEWETLHARIMQFRKERAQMSKNEASPKGTMHGMMGQGTSSVRE
jgi:hypothetical protein